MSLSPADPDAVASALLPYLADKLGIAGLAFSERPAPLGRGMDTHILSFALAGAGLDAAWAGPVVLRLYPTEGQAAKAKREADIQAFAASRGYPAVEPLLVDERAAPFELPLMVMPRVEGKPMLDYIAGGPWRTPSLLRRQAALQADLHALDIDGCPLAYDRPLVETRLELLRLEHPGDEELERGIDWLERHKGVVLDEEPVLCHGDFHPLNVLLADDGGTVTVLDWSDAALGDRHNDIARSALLFWIAPIIAESAVERIALRAARGYLQWQYLRAYRSIASMDERRLAYWKALHALDAWQLVTRLQDPEGDLVAVAREDSVARVPPELGSQLRDLFWKLAAADAR